MPSRCSCNCGKPSYGGREAEAKARGCYGAKRGNAGAKHCHRRQNGCEK